MSNKVTLRSLLGVIINDQMENTGVLISENILNDLERRSSGKFFEVDSSVEGLEQAAKYVRQLAVELKLVERSLVAKIDMEKRKQYERNQTKLKFENK